jgi:anti-sigma factor RsiW
MNCELCHENLDAYRAGSLPHDMRIQVEEHLKTCTNCAEVISLLNTAESVIQEEKEQVSNPFLSTRIMAAIEAAEANIPQNSPVFIKILRPAVITISLAAAVFMGIMIGNSSDSANYSDAVPLELALINDAHLESVSLLSTE